MSKHPMMSPLPPFGLLLRLLSIKPEQLRHQRTVEIDVSKLMQIIALASQSNIQPGGNVSDIQAEALQAYFSDEAVKDQPVDTEFYLSTNRDVAASVDGDSQEFAKQHFAKYGFKEGRAPNSELRPLYVQWLRNVYIKWRWDEDSDPRFALLHESNETLFETIQTLQIPPEHAASPGEKSLALRYAHHALHAPEANAVEILAWLAACGQRSAMEALAPYVASIKSERLLPRIAKVLDDHCRRFSGHLRAERDIALGAFLKSGLAQTLKRGELGCYNNDFLRGQAAELLARYERRSEAPCLPPTFTGSQSRVGKNHVFLGFFGQLRFPETTLQRLIHQVETALPGSELSVAVSSWDRSGVRTLVDEDPVGFVATLLPPGFNRIIQQKGIRSVAQFRTLFPIIGSYLYERSRENQAINQQYVDDLCGRKTDTILDPDEVYRSGPGVSIQNIYGDGSFMLNHGRMWSRIAALQTAYARAVERNGPASHCVILRPDLVISGDLGGYLREISSSKSGQLAFVDYDPRAMFTDSVGDRIFVCAPAVAVRLFDGENVMQRALSDDGTRELYRWFLSPHRFPQALLYEYGADIRPMQETEASVRIVRGGVNAQMLKSLITDELREAVDPAIIEFLSHALRSNEV